MTKRATISAPADAYQAATLRRIGVSRNRLRARDVRRVARGVLLHPDSALDPKVDRDRCIAIGRSLKDGHFISRRSAALIYEMPAPKPPGSRIEVGSFWPRQPPRRSYVTGHRVKPELLEWEMIDGVRVPSPADVWCQLAAVSSPTQLVQAGDHAISGKRIVGGGGKRTPALTNIDVLSAAVARHAGTAGSGLRERALPLLRCPVDSPPETETRLIVTAAGFPGPVVNCPVKVPYRTLHADLGYPDLMIAIEYEGDYHFTTTQQVRRDERRRAQMEAAGWKVLRVMNEDLRDTREFLQRLADAIAVALHRRGSRR